MKPFTPQCHYEPGLEVKRLGVQPSSALASHVAWNELTSHSMLTSPIWAMPTLGLMISPTPYNSHSSCSGFQGPARREQSACHRG